MEYYIRKGCRLCGSANLKSVLTLNDSSLCDAYLPKPKPQKNYPLGLNLCLDCSFVQLNTVVDPEIIYKDYIYVTTSSAGLDRHFFNYCDEICEYPGIEENGLVVDIGSNDGTFLKYFKNKNYRVVGVEPAIKIANDANSEGIKTYPDFFNMNLAEQITSENGLANIVTINNLFANIDDLHSFISGVDKLLSEDGVLVIEASYLYKMMENMVFDYIYHEHLSNFAAVPLISFFKQFDMHPIHFQQVMTKGGSIRFYFARNNSKWKIEKSVEEHVNRELSIRELCFEFEKFAQNIENEKIKIRRCLDEHKGKRIAGYGASATSTTLISHFSLNDYLTYLVDDNPSKIGTFSPGYHIPVYDPQALREDLPDIIVILAWRFKDIILNRINKLPCKILIPLPNFMELT